MRSELEHNRIITAMLAVLFTSLLWIGAMVPAQAESKVDRQFITSTQNAGYYIDVNTIEIVKSKAGEETVVDIYRVEPKKNRMYMDRMHFLTGRGKAYSTQQKEYQYDNRALLVKTSIKTIPGYYQDQSPEGECLTAAQEWKRTHIHKTKSGEWLD